MQNCHSQKTVLRHQIFVLGEIICFLLTFAEQYSPGTLAKLSLWCSLYLTQILFSIETFFHYTISEYCISCPLDKIHKQVPNSGVFCAVCLDHLIAESESLLYSWINKPSSEHVAFSF